ncbi:MAG: DNA polymerase III subunit gamma/tau [Bacilli bacterium]|nr:DNA polymerase III subunit gamma/tau [Bacilli bacterium]
MAYKALYRTYRPSTFEEVAGQEHIVKTLKNALATRKLAHAYLFAGPRGTGKTTMAKLLAKALNCDEGIGCQCNECKNCKAIIDGTHPDVIELDAASNNGVDEIRELIDKVKYGTILGCYKVYIIDEVHMLSTGAFNALLKTLEEPPEHVIFILATTEPHKILPTILSRCQRYDFTKLSDDDINNRLRSVLEKEGIAYNEEAIKIIISLADGGMRDALSILDQVLAYSGNKLEVQDILDIFALESKEEKIALLNSIISKDVSDVLQRINRYVSLGTDIKRLTDDLLLILKDILIYQSSRNIDCLEILTEQEAASFFKHLDIDETLKMIDIIMGAQKDYKTVNSIIPLFEVTILKLVATKKDGSANVAQPKPVEPVYEKPASEPAPRPVPQPKPEPAPAPKQEEIISLLDQPEPEPQTAAPEIVLSKDVLAIKNTKKDGSFFIDDDLMLKIMVISKKDIKNSLIDNWSSIKKLIAHPELGRAATMLADGRPLVASAKVLVVEYQFPSIAEKANLLENQEAIQNVIESVFNKKMFVYAVSRKDSIRWQQNYMNSYQLGKLPKPDTINIEFEGE